MAKTKKQQGTWRQRWIPHPLLSAILVYLWMSLLNDFNLGTFLMGLILGIWIPILTSSIWDRTPHVASLFDLLIFAIIFVYDVIVANLEVALIILFRPVDKLRTQWVTVPLDVKSSEAIAALALTVSLTPGTVSCDLSADSKSLLVHALDSGDAQAIVRLIKQRYESRLKRIFE